MNAFGYVSTHTHIKYYKIGGGMTWKGGGNAVRYDDQRPPKWALCVLLC